MATSFTLTLTALQVVALLLGVVTNGFMIGVNLSNWKHCRSLTASDHFICAVGFSNLSLQIWSGFSWFCDFFWNMGFFCRAAYALKMTSIQCSLMLSEQLCVFYCTKILIFNHNILRWYQQRFLESYRKIIIYSVIICIVMGGALLWIGEKHLSFLNNSSISNTATDNYYYGIYRIFAVSYGYIMPLVFTVGSASLIIMSLLRHMKRMSDALNTKHEVFTDAHLRAGFTVLSLLIVFVIYFITAIVNVCLIFKEGDPGFGLCQLVFMLYAPAHGLVLIRGNSKLKKAAAKVQEKIVGILKPKGWIKENSALK